MEPDLDLSCCSVTRIFECIVDEVEYELGDAVTIELYRRKSIVEIELEIKPFTFDVRA